MKKNVLGKTIILIPIVVLILFALTSASDGDIVKFQGSVMELDLKKNYMVVNEKQIVWDPTTIFNNEKGSPISIDKLKVKAWVYVEGVGDKVRQKIVANKIYLLPKYINEKEKSLYPFMQ